jgi:putative phosphoesterase
MKVALLGDVHANLPALEVVLEHAMQQGIGAIWNIGDFLGYGAYPDEVVKRLRHEGAINIIGNYDLKVLRFPKKKRKWRKSKLPEKYLAFQWAYENLSEDSRRYLSSLPEEIRMQVAGKSILIIHGSPLSNEECLYPETPKKRLRKLSQVAQADIIIFGHSHQHFARLVDDVWFINTGTVGRPDDGDPRACYAILQITDGIVSTYHHRVAYDVNQSVAAIRERGLPEAFAQMMLQGRNLDTVLSRMT